METIVVPIDFSSHSLNALNIAASIARKKSNCMINMVHVYEKPISGLTLQFEVNTKDLHKMRKEIFEKMDDLSKGILEGIEVDKTIVADIPVEKILELEAIRNADMIVMGTHGVSGWKEAILGSNAQRIVRGAECPVFVIKKDVPDFDLKNVLYVSDFLELEKVNYKKIENVIQPFDPYVHLLKVIDNDVLSTGDFKADYLVDFAEKQNLKKFTVNRCLSSSIEEGVREYSEKLDIDCVIIETHGRTGVNRFLQSSVAETLVNHLDRPVMTVRM